MDSRSRLDMLLNVDQDLKLRPTSHGECFIWVCVNIKPLKM